MPFRSLDRCFNITMNKQCYRGEQVNEDQRFKYQLQTYYYKKKMQ